MDLGSLRSTLHGRLFTRDDDGFADATRGYNLAVARLPLAVARCADVDDVQAGVRFAAEHGLPVAVRAGGRGLHGGAVVDDALVLDLSRLKGVRVRRKDARVRVEGGVVWAELDAATQEHGLAVPGPALGSVGVTGSTLGGGFGWISRRYGLSADNLVSADVVVADGSVVHASAESEPELFWALRGAGAGCGVVTALEFALHPLGDVAGGEVIYPLDLAGTILRALRDMRATMPDALAVWLVMSRLDANTPVVSLYPCWCGPVDEAAAAIKPLLAFGDPLSGEMHVHSYLEQQRFFTVELKPVRTAWSARLVDPLDDAHMDGLVDAFRALPGAQARLNVEDYSGAIARVPPEATAFAFRSGAPLAVATTEWSDAVDDQSRVEATLAAVAKCGPMGPLNQTSHVADDKALLAATGGEAHAARVAAVRRRFDPHGILRAVVDDGAYALSVTAGGGAPDRCAQARPPPVLCPRRSTCRRY